jgi:uncharacterized protein with HEPN domain
MSERSIPFLITDINVSIENILSFVDGMTFEMYFADLRTIHAVQHNFMIIGKAAERIPGQYKEY